MHDIFISYSSKDREWVAKLAKALEAQGYEVWWDPEILPGQHYQDVIQKALHGAKSVIAVWTADSVQSDYVRAECLWAFGKRNLISVLGKDAEIPTPFNAIQAADLRKWKGSADDPQFQRLLRGIRFAQTGEASQPPKVEPPAPKSRMGVVLAGVAAVAVAGAGVYWQQNGGFAGEDAPAVVEPAKSAAKPKPVAAPVESQPVAKPEAPKSYQLTVKTMPENAAITVDGNAYEAGKQWTPGTYTVKAVAEGHKSAEQAVIIKDQDAQISLTLEAIRYALTINVKPENAKISLSGGLGYSPGMLLKPGDYVVKVEANGYQSKEDAFTIAASDKILILELKPEYLSPSSEIAINKSKKEMPEYNKMVGITPDISIVTVKHKEASIKIRRNQDSAAVVAPTFAKTSRPCPPFCIQPDEIADGVETIAELSLLNYLEKISSGDNSILVIDARTPDWVAATGTIPGSKNIPWADLSPEEGATTDGILKVLREFGVRLKDGKDVLSVDEAIAAGDKIGQVLDYSTARVLVIFSNGMWSSEASVSIKYLLTFGYPPSKIKWYRGGMQEWELLGLTVVDKRER